MPDPDWPFYFAFSTVATVTKGSPRDSPPLLVNRVITQQWEDNSIKARNAYSIAVGESLPWDNSSRRVTE